MIVLLVIISKVTLVSYVSLSSTIAEVIKLVSFVALVGEVIRTRGVTMFDSTVIFASEEATIVGSLDWCIAPISDVNGIIAEA